jgi:hypothetical protein
VPRHGFLPRTTGKRWVLGILSLVLLAYSTPFAAIAVLWVLVGPARNGLDPLVRIFFTAFLEFHAAVFLVTLLGLVWAVWMPFWVARWAQKVTSYVMLTFLLMVALGIALVLVP